jgi:hypothetical protein
MFCSCSGIYDDGDDPVQLSGDVFVYSARVTASDRNTSYSVQGELIFEETGIRVLSYDGGQWYLNIRINETLESGVQLFFIDLQNVKRDNEQFLVRGNVHDQADGRNGFYNPNARRLEFSYRSTQKNQSVDAVFTATAK